MDDVTQGVNDQPWSATPEHRRHDRLLVSRFAAGDAYPTELAEARMMVESCVACAELARDIRALMAAIVNLPAPARPRDFRLTAEQAQALAGGPVDRWLRRLAGARSFSYLRPAAAAVMSLGLVVAVIGSGVPLPQAATPAAAPADGRLYVATPEVAATPAPAEAPVPVDAPAPADEPDPGEAAPGAPPMMQPNGTSAAGRTGAEDTTARHEAMSDFDRAYELSLDELKAADLAAGPAADPARSALTVGGLLLAAAGLGLLLFASIARRRARDPLLR